MDNPPKKSPALALTIGFIPAVLSLLVGTLSGQNGPKPEVLWPLFFVFLTCCFTSSFLLFRRKTGWAIAGGLLLLLLNGAISFFTGCLAIIGGLKF